MEGYATCDEDVLKRVRKKAGRLERIRAEPLALSRAFVMALRESVLADRPAFEDEYGSISASRGNWTYHFATKMREVSRCFRLACKFEATGRYDAIVHSLTGNLPVLVAEWEWDFEDVFGPGKELDKLIRAAKEHGSTADCLLITYHPEDRSNDLVAKSIKMWRRNTGNLPATLYLVIVVFSGSSLRQFRSLRVVEIRSKETLVWGDLAFSENEEEE